MMNSTFCHLPIRLFSTKANCSVHIFSIVQEAQPDFSIKRNLFHAVTQVYVDLREEFSCIFVYYFELGTGMNNTIESYA